MANKRRYTQELLKARALGRQIVVSSSVMVYPLSTSTEWPVVYRPRYTTDSRPWLALLPTGEIPAEGKGLRYSGRECTVESRHVVLRPRPGAFLVRDLQIEVDGPTFTGEGAYRKAELYAIEMNRADRRELLNADI